MKLKESSYALSIQQQKKVVVNFDIPVDLPGATGVFALRILQERATVGQVQVKLNYTVPFFVRFRNIPVYQSIKITNLFVRDLSEEPDDTYGDFESLITPEIENNDNISFLSKGFENNDIRNSNRLFRFSDFSERKTYYTFCTPYVLPRDKTMLPRLESLMI